MRVGVMRGLEISHPDVGDGALSFAQRHEFVLPGVRGRLVTARRRRGVG